jgi:hypothetical protein
MFGGKHHISDAGKLCQCGPNFGMEFARIEGLRQIFEEALGIVRRSTHQGVADDDTRLAIHAPVDEHAEALIAKPFQALRFVERAGVRVVRRLPEGKSRRDENRQQPHNQ